MTPRRLRELGAAVAVVAVVSGILVAAVQADGRTSVRTDTNDGGAWLVRRSDGLTGHLNRAVGEVSGVVHIAGPGAEFDVEQADGIVLGHDRSLSTLTVVDPRTFQIVNDVAVPADARVAAVTGGAIVWQPAPLRVWSLDVAALDEHDVDRRGGTDRVDGRQRIGAGRRSTRTSWCSTSNGSNC